MEQSVEIAQSLLNLSVGDFFAGDRLALDKIEWKLSSRDFRGLALGVPNEVDIKLRETLPVVLASQLTAVRDWETPLDDNLALVLFDHGTAEVAIAKPFEERRQNPPDRGWPRAKPPQPTGDAATGVATSARRVDIRKLFSLDWRPRRLSLMAISFDVVSNEADVSLIGGPGAPSWTARPIAPPAPLNGLGLPSYDPGVVGVKPVAKGVAFAIEATPSDWVVRGSLSTIAQARHLAHAGVSQSIPGAKTKKVAGVVPLTFVMAGRNWRVPWAFEWGIPVYGDGAMIGTQLSGAFAIPLPKEKLPAQGGDYAAYIILEGRIFGPQKFTMPTLRN